MDSFFTGANLTWIIGIISSIAAGLSALSKFRYQNKLKLFKETNINIFKKEKKKYWRRYQPAVTICQLEKIAARRHIC